MKLSKEGIEVAHHFEGCKLEAYPDPGSKDGNPWTIGYGHTGPEVVKGLVWTQFQADQAFIRDMAKFENQVSNMISVAVEQWQFDALVLFAYNVGCAALKSSTLLRKLNVGDYEGAANELRRWNKNDGKVMRGLTRRRAAEEALFRGCDAKEAIKKGMVAA